MSSNSLFWTQKHSIKLTKIVIYIVLFTICLIFISAPFAKEFLINQLNVDSINFFPLILITLYVGGVLGVALMYFLLKLINNIDSNQVFIWENIYFLRIISWICLLGSLVGIISTAYWLIWFPVAFMAAFICLIIRVIKNILSTAIRIKEENDYTI